MKTTKPPQKQLGLTSRISNAIPAQNLGQLTPVHLEDVIRDRNLDYLESLGELVERTPATPVWYEYETLENKVKFLRVYQVSINYAHNTEAIYGGVISEMGEQLDLKKSKIEKLKAEILAHKQKTSKLKKQYQKQKLLKEREKVLAYQQKLKSVRDAMKKQKRELEAKNEQKRKELEEMKRREQAHEETESKPENPMNFLQQFSGHHLSPHQHYPYMPHPQMIPPGYYPYPYPPPPVHSDQHIPHFQQKSQQSSQPIIASIKRADSLKQSDKSFGMKIGSSGNIKKSLNNQLKQSKKSKEENKNSDKAWTLRNSDYLKQSNIESQKQDKVDELIDRKSIIIDKRTSVENSKMSRKSSEMDDADIGSFMDIQLKTESKNDIDGHTLQFKKTTSILNKKKFQQPPKQPQHVPQLLQPPKNQTSKKYENSDTQIKIISSKQKHQPDASIDLSANRAYGYGYLEQSNRGNANANSNQNFALKVNKGLRLKESNRIGRSIANSMEDVESRNGSKLILDDQEIYKDDFQNSGDLGGVTLTDKTRVKVNVDFSESSPEKQPACEFAPLYKNYFILKEQAANIQNSKQIPKSARSMRSIKQSSVKFSGADKKTLQNKSQLLSQNTSGDMLQIDMPMNSIIAKPSKLKMSTIIRKSGIQKVNRSHDSKVPATFIIDSPAKPMKEVRFAESVDVIDDNFAKIGALKSIRMPKKDNENANTLAVPPKPEHKLSSLQMAQSHVIQEQINEQQKSECEKMVDERSLDLSVIEESENDGDSRFSQQNSVKQKILLLIDKKYKQKGAAQYDKDIVKNQIEMLQKSMKEQNPTWQMLTDAFNQMSKNKQEQVNALIQIRKNRAKTNKKKSSSRQSSQKIMKITEKIKSNISKISQKQEDDLMYSRSLLQNPNSDNPNLKKKDSTQAQPPQPQQKRPQQKSVPKTKYIRQQKQTNNTRILQKIKESSKFDQDDELENAIKNNNFRLKSEEREKEKEKEKEKGKKGKDDQDDDDSF